jgi:hypothetical protein
MLTNLDETLLHQAPWPFRMAGVSDHRFFDRYWFEALDPAGEVALISGLAVYKNMAVLDGYASVQRDGHQRNLRMSRRLPDDLVDLALGPLSVTVIDPFRRLRLQLSPNEHGVACDLEWSSDFPPYVEGHHLEAGGLRITTDSTRYDQAGRWQGWVEVDGVRTERDDWWGARDHSWGVRPGVGGFEPAHSRQAVQGMLFIWCLVATDEFTLQFQLREDADGRRQYLDGQMDHRVGDGRASVRVQDVRHSMTFVPGTRAYEHAEFDVALADGRELHLAVEPWMRPWAYAGTGYDGGYSDRRGLGAARGEVVEFDTYELPDLETVLLEGAPAYAGHREQPARVTVDGVPTFGHCPVMTAGVVKRYGLG